MTGPAKTIVKSSLDALVKDASGEKSKLGQIFRKVASHPFKMFAAFFTAPILLIRLALKAKSPTRKFISVLGLVFAMLVAYAASTFLGSVVGAIFVMSHVGILVGIGFLIGSMLSVILSITFSIFVFNLISFLVLKMNTQEVLDHLKDISGGP